MGPLHGIKVIERCCHIVRTVGVRERKACLSGKPTAYGVPFGDGLKAMNSDLGSGAVCRGWNEEVADGGEDGHEVL